LLKFFDAANIDVEADDAQMPGEGNRQRQADVAKTDNRNFAFNLPHGVPSMVEK
jgi:hypothetical protein